MAGGKETPRQKMIGMMYLVLTALLALNISKDILNAFVQINRGLGKTNIELEKKADATIDLLRNSKETEKAAPFLAKSEEVEKKSNELLLYLEQLKAHTMAASAKANKTGEGWEEYMNGDVAIDVGDTEKVKKPDENQNNTALLVGGHPQTPRTDPWSANELKTKMEQFRDYLKSITVKPAEANAPDYKLPAEIVAAIESTFSFGDENDADGNPEKWETNKFYHTPLVAVIATMSKIQTDIQNAKADVLTALTSGINKADIKFSNVTVAVVPKQSYVLRGDSFVAEIYLAAYNKTTTSTVYIGSEFSEMPKDTTRFDPGSARATLTTGADGKARFKLNTGSVGLGDHGYRGMIEYMKPSGEKEQIPFNIPPFTVAEPALVVSPSKMNVFYRGLDNPVEVSVPGVDGAKVKASCAGHDFKKNPDGTYTIKPGAGQEAIVSVTATVNGKETKIGEKKFRVKKIPDPVPVFAGKSPMDNVIKKGDATAALGMQARMDNFDFEVTATIKSFNLVISKDGQVIEKAQTGNKLSDDMKTLIGKMKPGERVYFEKIIAKMPDGTDRPLANISLRIIA